MAAMSEYLEKALLQHVFGGGATGTIYSPPPHIYIGLFTAALNDEFTNAVEVVGNNYQRIEVIFASVPLDDSGAGSKISNTNIVQFPAASTPWGLVTHMGVFDSSITGHGNLLLWGQLFEPKTIGTNDIFMVSGGDLVISLD